MARKRRGVDWTERTHTAWDAVPVIAIVVMAGWATYEYYDARAAVATARKEQPAAIRASWTTIKNGDIRYQLVQTGLDVLLTIPPADLEAALGPEDYPALKAKLAEYDDWKKRFAAAGERLKAAQKTLDAAQENVKQAETKVALSTQKMWEKIKALPPGDNVAAVMLEILKNDATLHPGRIRAALGDTEFEAMMARIKAEEERRNAGK